MRLAIADNALADGKINLAVPLSNCVFMEI
jgi:hypothetical protein